MAGDAPKEPGDALKAEPAKRPAALDLPVVLSVVVAERMMPLGDVLAIQPGSVIEFDKPVEEALTVEIHGIAIARGKAVKRGERFGLRISEIVPPQETVRAMGGRGRAG